MKRIHINPITGLSGYALSHMVAQLEAVTGVDKAVLRALSDHYPNVWADVDTIAIESGWSARAVRESMRRLEGWNWINGVRPLEERLGGQGNSDQYVINDRKIVDAHAVQRLEWVENPAPAAWLIEINPAPHTGLVKYTRQHAPSNPAPRATEPGSSRTNPAPTAGEPTIEPTNEPTTNQPPTDWVEGLERLHGQRGLTIPAGLNAKGVESILDRIKIDGWPLVAKSFELCLDERSWNGLTRSNVAHWFLKEYSQWIARAKAVLAEPQIDRAAIKAQIDAQNEEYRRTLANRVPEKVCTIEELLGAD
jgi:hypothetical protein